MPSDLATSAVLLWVHTLRFTTPSHLVQHESLTTSFIQPTGRSDPRIPKDITQQDFSDVSTLPFRSIYPRRSPCLGATNFVQLRLTRLKCAVPSFAALVAGKHGDGSSPKPPSAPPAITLWKHPCYSLFAAFFCRTVCARASHPCGITHLRITWPAFIRASWEFLGSRLCLPSQVSRRAFMLGVLAIILVTSRSICVENGTPGQEATAARPANRPRGTNMASCWQPPRQ